MSIFISNRSIKKLIKLKTIQIKLFFIQLKTVLKISFIINKLQLCCTIINFIKLKIAQIKLFIKQLSK